MAGGPYSLSDSQQEGYFEHKNEASLVFSTRCIVTHLTNLLSSARDWRTLELPTPGLQNWAD